jgi:hypothetical protein
LFNEAGASSEADVSLSPAFEDLIELCGQLYDHGDGTAHVELIGVKNSGSEVADTTSTTIDLPAAFSAELIALGSTSSTTGQGDIELITAKHLPGTYSMSAARLA